jgi:DNA-binding HxlR family transcriptional regulator
MEGLQHPARRGDRGHSPRNAFLDRGHPHPIAGDGVALEVARTVMDRPGIHFRRLGRAVGLTSTGHLRHHLDRLKLAGILVEVKDGHFSRFFPAHGGGWDIDSRLARFAHPVPRLIGELLLGRPMSRTELRHRLRCADSTLGYHLDRLVRLGELEKRPDRNPSRRRYALADPALVRRSLLLQGKDRRRWVGAFPPEPGMEAGRLRAARRLLPELAAGAA